VTVHGKAPIGTHPHPGQAAPPARERQVITKAAWPVSSRVSSRARWCLIILTVLKRSVVLWVKEATGR
jgi:hypothetical protein